MGEAVESDDELRSSDETCEGLHGRLWLERIRSFSIRASRASFRGRPGKCG
jgi:hypothetical protein